MSAIERIARRMCRTYYHGLSVKRSEDVEAYIDRMWEEFAPIAAAALEEMAAIMAEMAEQEVKSS